jgi:hypothetical protein
MDLPQDPVPNELAPGERLTMVALMAEARREFGSFEHGFWYTAKELIVRPGLTMAAVWRGDHARYTGPFRFFMLSFTIYALVWITTGAMELFWAAQREQMVAQTMPDGRTFTPDIGAVYLEHPLVTEFGTVIMMWVSTWIWFWGVKLNAAERVALPLYWYGLMNLIQVPLFWIAFTGPLLTYTQVIGAAGVLYVAWGTYTAFEPRRWWQALRGIAWWVTGALLWGMALGLAAGIRQGFNAG